MSLAEGLPGRPRAPA